MKTIITSIANQALYRNFAMFEGSAIYALSQVDTIRLVILKKKGQDPDFDLAHLGQNVIIEEIAESMHKNVLQQAFYFFYSFLIFTDTTKLVSSYGVRADKPRPLFRYWNYPIKLFIAKVFGRWPWMRERAVPWLYFKIFASYRPYKEVFARYSPDMAFLPNICIWPADLEILVEAKRNGVATVGMPGNWDHLSKYYIPFRPDKLLVWSEATKREAAVYQFYDPSVVTAVGSPQIDFFIREKNIAPREEFLRKIGFESSNKIILYASQGPYSLDGPDYIEMLLQWIEAGKLPPETRLIVRPHPHARFEKEKYEKFRGHKYIYHDEREGWSSEENARHFSNIVAHADVVVTTYSSVATEASIWDRPTIIASFDGYKTRPIYQSVKRHKNFTHFQDVIKTGGVWVAEDQDEFYRALTAYLHDPSIHGEGRERLRQAIFGFFDGKNSARIVEHILKAL